MFKSFHYFYIIQIFSLFSSNSFTRHTQHELKQTVYAISIWWNITFNMVYQILVLKYSNHVNRLRRPKHQGVLTAVKAEFHRECAWNSLQTSLQAGKGWREQSLPPLPARGFSPGLGGREIEHHWIVQRAMDWSASQLSAHWAFMHINQVGYWEGRPCSMIPPPPCCVSSPASACFLLIRRAHIVIKKQASKKCAASNLRGAN